MGYSLHLIYFPPNIAHQRVTNSAVLHFIELVIRQKNKDAEIKMSQYMARGLISAIHLKG